MKMRGHIRGGRSFGLALCLLMLTVPTVATAAPCTTVDDCKEWFSLPPSAVRLLLYRSFPLDTKNAAITRAMVVVHGASRDADNYFRHMLAAAFLAGELEKTVVIAPRFASTNGGCADTVADKEA